MSYFSEDPLSLTINDEAHLDFSKHLEKQRVLQPAYIIRHSKESEMLVSLLQYADSRRYNIPVTQMPGTLVYLIFNKLSKFILLQKF